MRRTCGLVVTGLLAVAVGVSACGADRPVAAGHVDAIGDRSPPATGGGDGVPASTTTARPPLADPPDPGPTPDSDGLEDGVREAAMAAIGRVTGVACGRAADATAFAVEPDLLVTVGHALVGLDAVRVELTDGSDAEAAVVAFDGRADLAALHLPGAALRPLAIGDGADGTTGAVVAWEAGGPETEPFRIDRPVTVRIDDAARTERVERPSWLVAAMVDSGDSGAPLVAADGAVVGVVYATTRRPEAAVAYAVRSSELAPLLAEAGARREVVVPGC